MLVELKKYQKNHCYEIVILIALLIKPVMEHCWNGDSFLLNSVSPFLSLSCGSIATHIEWRLQVVENTHTFFGIIAAPLTFMSFFEDAPI